MNEPLGHFNVVITIQRISDLTTVTYGETFPYWDLVDGEPDWGSLHYIWSDGNYSCNCNRELFFYRNLGLVEPSDESYGDSSPCAGPRRYRVRVTLENGYAVVDDFKD